MLKAVRNAAASRLAARRVGARGRVCAFEPNPAVRRQLERHVELNQVADRVTVAAPRLDEDRRRGGGGAGARRDVPNLLFE